MRYDVLKLRVPAVHTEHARTLLAPWLLPDGLTVEGAARILTLHPRVGALPDDVREAASALGAWEPGALTLDEAEARRLFTVVFFSRSSPCPPLAPGLPPTWRQVLSNFWAEPIALDGAVYPSAEHAFHACKARCSDRPERAADLRVGGAVGGDPAAAKKAGSRGSYRAAGATLDLDAWNAARDEATAAILAARHDQQPLFRSVLASTRGLTLLHFERAGARSYWGGSLRTDDAQIQGENRLGLLLMALRDRA